MLIRLLLILIALSPLVAQDEPEAQGPRWDYEWIHEQPPASGDAETGAFWSDRHRGLIWTEQEIERHRHEPWFRYYLDLWAQAEARRRALRERAERVAKDDELQALIRKARGELNREKRAALIAQIRRLWASKYPELQREEVPQPLPVAEPSGRRGREERRGEREERKGDRGERGNGRDDRQGDRDPLRKKR